MMNAAIAAKYKCRKASDHPGAEDEGIEDGLY